MKIVALDIQFPCCDWIVPICNREEPVLQEYEVFLVSKEVIPEFRGVQIIVDGKTPESDCFTRKIHYRSSNPDSICDVIRLYKAVHTFGDSHSIISCRISICRENWLGFNSTLPLTMNRIGREGLDLHQAVKTIGNGHEKFPIRPGDWVMYFYGEIDARYLVLKQFYGRCKSGDEIWTGNISNMDTRPVSEIIDKLINSYMKTIKDNEARFKCRSIIYGIQPPTAVTSGANMYTGTLEERIQVWKEFTYKLYKRCMTEDIRIVDMAPHISGPDGLIRPELLKEHGDIHIHLSHYGLVRDEIMRVVQKPEPYGFIVPACVRTAEHLESLNRCIRSIRKYHPVSTIVVVKDFSSSTSIPVAFDDPYIVVEENTISSPADMLVYDFLLRKKYFEKAIIVQDSMEVLSKFDVSQVSSVSYLWHFTNHRTQWDVIREPDTEANRQNNIVYHSDLVRHCIGKIPEDYRLFREYAENLYEKKSEWYGCFGCLTIMSQSFLNELNQKTGIIGFMHNMRDNRLRRAIESIFSLACHFTLGKNPESYDGLYFDGVSGNNSVSVHIRKYSFNRQ